MPFSFLEVIGLLVLGLVAGAVGGMVGVGGSVIMIPVLTLAMGRDQHLAQAAAMIVNVFVAAPALLRHHQAEAVRWDVMRRMLPTAMVFILVGVWSSNRFDGDTLKKLFGVFLIYVIAFNILKLMGKHPIADDAPRRVGWTRVGSVGGVMGFAAGLLGIGGGAIAVPLLQRICHLPLRQAIASSSAVMCLTAVFGAIYKNASLEPAAGANGPLFADSLLLAACLAPTATVGALFGADLTHRLPLAWVRLAFVLLMIWACVQMLGLL